MRAQASGLVAGRRIAAEPRRRVIGRSAVRRSSSCRFTLPTHFPRLHDALTRIIADQHLPGGTAAISIGGRVVTTAVGFSDSAKHVAMRPSHRMLVGSAAKPFFTYVVLSAAAEGKLDLDAPVSRWLGAEPWFPHLPNAPASASPSR